MRKYFERLYNKSNEEFNLLLKEHLINNEKKFIVTANPETFMKSLNDNDIQKLLSDKETILVPDGIGVVKAAKMLDIDIKERITGVDIAYQLLKLGNELNKTIYLFGASQSVIDKMKNYSINVIFNDDGAFK